MLCNHYKNKRHTYTHWTHCNTYMEYISVPSYIYKICKIVEQFSIVYKIILGTIPILVGNASFVYN